MFGILTKLTESIPSVRVNRADRIIYAPDLTDGFIQIRSAGASLRGQKLNFVGFDEVIDIPNFLDIWQSDIMPSLSTTKGKALFISSVFAYDHFWELVLKAQDDKSGLWKAFVIDAYQAGVIPLAELELQRREMPIAKFQREFMCKPVELGAVFQLDEANRDAHPVSTALDGHVYVGGVDIGGSVDPTVVAIIDVSVDPVECVFMDVFLNPSFSAQVERIRDVWQRFNHPPLVTEANNVGTSLIQDMHAVGMNTIRSLTTTNASKANQVEALKLAFENHRLRVIDDSALLLELAAFESSKTPSGLVHYAASKGHDDRVMALLLAYAGTAVEPKPTNQFIANPLFPNGTCHPVSIFDEYTDAERRQHYAELVAKQRGSSSA